MFAHSLAIAIGGDSERVLVQTERGLEKNQNEVAQTKRDWESDCAYLCKNKLYFFVFRGGKIIVILYTIWYCMNSFWQIISLFLLEETLFPCPVSSPVTFFNILGS